MSFDSLKRNILKKSDSYNFYKNAYDKSKYNETLSEKLDESFFNIQKEYRSIESYIHSLKELSLEINRQINDFSKVWGSDFDSLRDDVCCVKDNVDSLSDDFSKVTENFKNYICYLNKINTSIEKIPNQNKNLMKELIIIKEQLSFISKSFEHQLNNYQKLKSEVFINKRFLKEMNYAHVFKDTINDSDWLFNKSFSANNAAANYSFLYILYRILDEIKPSKILELGLGQTTLLTSQYVNFFKNADLQVVEDNEKWIEYFSNKLNITSNVKINLVNKREILINSFKCLKYENFSNLIKDDLFNLIIIDGPYGANQEYPRSNIWDLINNLADNFVIIIDDYDRQGEINTSKILLDKLSENGIIFNTSVFRGIKNQLVIYSKNNYFIGWF